MLVLDVPIIYLWLVCMSVWCMMCVVMSTFCCSRMLAALVSRCCPFVEREPHAQHTYFCLFLFVRHKGLEEISSDSVSLLRCRLHNVFVGQPPPHPWGVNSVEVGGSAASVGSSPAGIVGCHTNSMNWQSLPVGVLVELLEGNGGGS